MKYYLIGLMGLLLSCVVQATEPALMEFQGLSGKIDIAGGTAHIPVMKDAAKAIMQQYPHIRITVTGGGSGAGVKQVSSGLVHIGNTGRPLMQSEIDKYGLVSYPFAIDGVTVVVNPKNPVTHLTSEQIADIYSGKLTNWSQVGGENIAINIYSREDSSGTREIFTEKMMGKRLLVPNSNIIGSNGSMKTAIARDRYGIGYVGIGHLDKSVKAPLLNGIKPTQENAASGKYPIVRMLYMNTKGQPTVLTQAFINYIYSSTGQEIIRHNGYIPFSK